jgi:hypothetical protein
MCLLAVSLLAGQDSSSHLQLPDSVYGFSLVETSPLGGTAGTAYRYRGTAKTWADVFVYSVPIERIHGPDSVQLTTEVEAYLAGLAYGIERGRYDSYQVPVNTSISVDTKNGSVSGRAVVMVYRRGNESFVSLMHLFVLKGSYVKVRLTLPAAEWSNSMAPNFALELAKVLFS